MLSLKSSVFFSQFEEGVVFRGNGAPLIFRGKRAYDLAGMLFTQLEQGASREDLLNAMPQTARDAADQLLSSLEKNSLLRNRNSDDSMPEKHLAPRFSNLWNYLADNHRAPGKALAEWFKVTFYVEGSGAARIYAGRALAESAAQHIILSPTDEDDLAATEEKRQLESIVNEFGGIRIDRRASDIDASLAPGTIKIYAGGAQHFSPDTKLSDAWFFGLLAGHLVLSYVPGRLCETLPKWEQAMRPAIGEHARLPDLRIMVAAGAVAFGIFKEFCEIDDGPASRTHMSSIPLQRSFRSHSQAP